jgi:hypothetical protein
MVTNLCSVLIVVKECMFENDVSLVRGDDKSKEWYEGS